MTASVPRRVSGERPQDGLKRRVMIIIKCLGCMPTAHARPDCARFCNWAPGLQIAESVYYYMDVHHQTRVVSKQMFLLIPPGARGSNEPH
ncbi:hypothetical protein RRG08_065805 [Elysia crispata]|uniref:Uncharacterized protein n=1 Tax=Elysia crispata TaxID=231223 RepID=A0AAE0ZSH0_9GAST|nr:hypothetical protein RRG08_065805 [Elysia crispata]